MQQTEHYKLSQWDLSDRIQMSDFNADNARLDDALWKHNASLKTHANQLLGVPALGRNLYNLFLRQKNAGQDVSWMEGLFYDDFSDQSKIESMGTGMSWSSSEKRVHFTPVNGELDASMVTTVFQPKIPYTCAYAWVRFSICRWLDMEYRKDGDETWTQLEYLRQDPFWSANVKGEKAAELIYYLPARVGQSKFQLRFTVHATDTPSYWPIKLYDYGFMLM